MAGCYIDKLKEYIAYHMEEDAKSHTGMTTEEYRKSHPMNWESIGWNEWVAAQVKQAVESQDAADFIRKIPSCEDEPLDEPLLETQSDGTSVTQQFREGVRRIFQKGISEGGSPLRK